jgi:hypothetical protein
MAAGDRRERTYGNWRRPVSPGLGALGMLGTAILLGGLILVIVAMMISLWAGLVAAGVLVLVLAPLVIRDRYGRTALQAATARIAWLRGRAAGQHLYRSGPLGVAARGSFRLPGLLAASRLVEASDSYGRPFAMVVIPATGHHTVVFDCGAEGAALVDADQVDTWVAYWGQWLAALAYEPGLVAASVTIETAPDFGHRLAQEVTGNVSAAAPPLARRVLGEVVQAYPAGSAQVSTRVAVTYAAAARPGGKRRVTTEMAREIGTRLPGLTQRLSMTGAGAARPMTAAQLAAAVRVAYDPEAQPLLDASPAGAAGPIAWGEAGPAAMQESWDHLRHDSGVSITWGLSDAPRGEVLSNVLTGLLVPHPDITRKRVTLAYRPHGPATAVRIVERDRRDARFRLHGVTTAARDAVAVAAADQSAAEEAKGAGLVRFTMLVTATVRAGSDTLAGAVGDSSGVVDELAAAAAAIDTLAPPARVRLRRMYGSQAAAFAAALPLGIVLPDHLQVPVFIREAM